MRTLIGQQLWRAGRRLLGLLLLSLVVLLGSGAAVMVQGGRDETRPAATAVVFTDGDASQVTARTDRASELYLRGQIGHIVLVGGDPESSQAALVGRGIQPIKINLVRAATQREQLDQLEELTISGQSVDGLLIAEPVELLRLQKMARDRGMDFHGAPPASTGGVDLLAVMREVGRYFAYVLGS